MSRTAAWNFAVTYAGSFVLNCGWADVFPISAVNHIITESHGGKMEMQGNIRHRCSLSACSWESVLSVFQPYIGFSRLLWLKISMNIHLTVEPHSFYLIILEYFSHTAGDKGYLWLKSVRQIAENWVSAHRSRHGSSQEKGAPAHFSEWTCLQ